MRHIVITGAMGVGKTTVGRLLAEVLDLPFLDSDEGLESRTGETGAEIVAHADVSTLHDLEIEVFLDMCRVGERSVIAPASSVVDQPEGRDAMSQNLTVWLTASDEVLAARQSSDGHRRPMGAKERARLRERRAPHLEAVSSMRVDTTLATPAEVVAEIIDRL